MTENLIEYERSMARKVFGLKPDADLQLNTEGWMSRVYIYKRGEYVIKYPVAESFKDDYRKEIKACPLFKNVHTDIPHIFDVPEDLSYIAYKGLKGQSLSTLNELSSQKKAETGVILGRFLKELHNMKPQGFDHFTLHDEISQVEDDFTLSKAHLKARFDADSYKIIERYITETFPVTMKELGEKSVFSHGDLGYWNLILQENGRIGIIDFGDADFYDESKDFVGMKDTVMLNAALKVYGDTHLLRNKIKIRQITLPVIELPYYIDRKDTVNTEAALRKIEMNTEDYRQMLRRDKL